MRRRSRVALGALVPLVAVLAWVTSPGTALETLQWVATDPLRLAVALVAVAAVRPLLAWPTTLLAVVAGYGFGLVGAPFALALVTLSSVPTFLVARYLGSETSLGAAGERFAAESGHFRSVVASRLLPAPSDVVSAAAGVAGVRLSAFVAGTTVGEVPWVVAGTVAGASLASLDGVSLADVADPRLVVAAAAFAAILLAGPLYRVARERVGVAER